MTPDELVTVLDDESRRCHALLGSADPSARVPACPDWSVDDLVWHLARGQWGWADMVDQGIVEQWGADTDRPTRPDDHDALVSLAAQATDRLLEVVTTAPLDTPVWSWTDHGTIGWVIRRQAHEALVHRVDAEGVSDALTSIAPDLASDGVDEVLRNMYGWAAARGRFSTTQATVRLVATDTGTGWDVQVGSLPEGEVLDGPGRGCHLLRVDDSEMPAPTATVRGDAEALHLWLWNRGSYGALSVEGDAGRLTLLRTLVGRGL